MSDVDPSNLAVLSHTLAALAFAALAGLLTFGRGRGASRLVLVAIALAELAWHGACAFWTGSPDMAAYLEFALPLRSLVIAGAIVGLVWLEGARPQARALGAALAAVGIAWAVFYVDFLTSGEPGSWMFFIQVMTPMAGLIALENWFRNTAQDQRWAVKFAVLGFGLMFAYDLLTYLAASITGAIDPHLVAARGAVGLIAVPLILVTTARRGDWATGLHVSRQAAFYSASVVTCGAIFLLAAAGGHYVRNVGGSIGTFVQIVGSVIVAVIVVVMLASSSARSRLKRLIEQNFFSYKYDYRIEWARFIETVGSRESYVSLPVRVVRAIADVLDSPGGVLWLRSGEGRAYMPVATWHVYGRLSPLPSEAAIFEALRGVRGVVTLHPDLTSRCAADERETLAPFWAAVPVRHSTVSGLVTLLPPRAVRKLGWEDNELLHTVGQQAASYLAEEAASRALLETQQLEEFSQRFAFVAHDLKNLISQLQLLLRNAERHKENPQFQRDLLSTLGNSVDKMKRLLDQIRPQRSAPSSVAEHEPVDLADVAGEIERRWAAAGLRFDRTVCARGITVRADGERLQTALDHVVQNAIEAAGPAGEVVLSVVRRGREGCVVVADDGPGMEEQFVREELFKPFRSTKVSGYGIGAYQARELVKSMGGSLEVHSAPGEGTRVTVALPSSDGSAAEVANIVR